MTTSAEILGLAAQYFSTGNIALAEQYATSILDQESNHAEALHLLGLIAKQKGKLQDAMAFLNRSLTANGSNGLAWQHAGDILLAGGDLPGGITYYEQALRLRPDFADGYNTLGMALQRAGNWGRAVECFQQALRLAPTFVPALNNLGTVLQNLGKWAEAAAVFEEALKLWPDSPDIAYNLGNTRFSQGDLNAAITCYRQALRLKPVYAAEVSNSLATALRTQGHWEEAVAQYRETLRLRPGHSMAVFNLSQMAVEGRCVFPSEELAGVKEALASGRGSEEDRRLWAFAVANVLDLQGAFDEAFRYCQQANDLRMRHFKKRNAAFNAPGHEALIDKIIADHGSSYFAMVINWGTRAELPVFIVGMPFSGAALVEEVLAGHSKVARVGEAGSVPRFLALAQSAADQNAATTTAQLLPDIVAARTAAASYLAYLSRLRQGAARVLVNSLDNFLSLGTIATLFPDARVIHCRRDPLDVGLACYFHNRRDLAFACSLDDIGAYYRAYDKLMAHWRRVLPLTIHEVNYDREKNARALIAYCGLDWEERAAMPTASGSADTSKEMIGHAQHYRTHLGPLIKALEG